MDDTIPLTAAERERFLGEVRKANKEALRVIGQAGAAAVAVVAIVENPDDPRRPAVSLQVKKSSECALSNRDITYCILRTLMSSLEGMLSDGEGPSN